MATLALERPPAVDESLHPVLKELSLDKSDRSAVRLLDYLVKHNNVSIETVQQAHQQLFSGASSTATTPSLQTSPPEVAVPAKKKQKNQHDSTTATIATDTTTIRKRHIALLIYYNGQDYSGLAENVGVPGDNSVERALFAALKKAHLVDDSSMRQGYSRSGRTDRGVSAAGQVVALPLKSAFSPLASSVEAQGPPLANADLPCHSHETKKVWVPSKKKKKMDTPWQYKELSEYPYDKILNNLLPPAIRVLGWAPVSNEFSARFSTSSRTYRYFYLRQWYNENKMRDGLHRLVGTHDFSNFCKMNISEVSNFQRTLHHAEIRIVDETVGYFEIRGQAFLWHQIRCIASILFLIGRGLEEPSLVTELLNVEKYPGKPSYPIADEHHLVLQECSYRNLKFGYSVPNLWQLSIDLRRQWEDHILMAARIHNVLDSLQNSDDVLVQSSELHAFAVSKKKRQAKKAKVLSQAECVPELSQVPTTIPWRDALQWLHDKCQLEPNPIVTHEFVHIPLLERSVGTSYKEKVASLLNTNSSAKRQQRYQENQQKKLSQTKEEDQAFYQSKLCQGAQATPNS